ncbi:hypothetical protein CCR75_008750 [Bremia lactucae]|uniref:Uncharacterized protein n=1 Tax=Bremia lactucae TaxID=4779 RepID=A0A976IK46_BRELC|nr:hypothetical protein CCR75_008750 [Bremia lactucae]
MRQRASSKAQRRNKQHLKDPYALTGDVYCESPTFHMGSLLTPVGMLQLMTALALGGFLLGGALVLCVAILAVLGLVLLHCSEPRRAKHILGHNQAIHQLMALRRSVLDCSRTLSTDQSKKYQQSQNNQIVVVPAKPTPQNVTTPALISATTVAQKRKPTHSKGDSLNNVQFTAINLPDMMEAQELFADNNEANLEPANVHQNRSLLPLNFQVQQHCQVQPKELEPQFVLKALEIKGTQVQRFMKQKKHQMVLKEAESAILKGAVKKVNADASDFDAKPNAMISAMLPEEELASDLEPVDKVSSALSSEVELPLTIFPKIKTLMEVVTGEPVMEQEVIFTRKVVLCINLRKESVKKSKKQDLKHDLGKKAEVKPNYFPEVLPLSPIEFPPLSSIQLPQALKLQPSPGSMKSDHSTVNSMLNPRQPFTISQSEQVGVADLRSMLDELNVMQSELDTAMTRCKVL